MNGLENLGPVAEGTILLWHCKHPDEAHAESADEMHAAISQTVGHQRWGLMCLTGDDQLLTLDPELLAAALRIAGWTVEPPRVGW